MIKYPISTLLYIAKINIKDTIKDALKLKNNIDVRLTITVKDKDGKIIKQHKQYSHSFVRNFMTILASAFYAYIFYDYQTTNNLWYSVDPNYTTIFSVLNTNDSSNDASFGIVVGTGTATPTATDYKLGNQIPNGTGSGQLSYGTSSISPGNSSVSPAASLSSPTQTLTPSGNTTSIQISRTFQNNSGSSITVTETGIIVKTTSFYNGLSTATTNELIVHDLLSSPITIQNSAVLTIVYTISVTT
jgi:hypothetical protein